MTGSAISADEGPGGTDMVTATPGQSPRETAPAVGEVPVAPLARARQFAWLAIVVADAGLLAWGAMAALAPACPGACMTAGYESFTGQSWSDLATTSAAASAFLLLVFRVYGAFNVAVGVVAIAIAAVAFRRAEAWAWWTLLVGNTIAFGSAMTYDRMVGFIGPFEMLEYVGLAAVYAALAVTAPFQARPAGRRPHR
jgi:hypothetical protein